MTAPETPWDEYVRTAAQLDAVRRDAAAAVVSQETAAAAAAEEVTAVRRRVALQRLRLALIATRLGTAPPNVDPLHDERAATAHVIAPTDPIETGDPTAAIAAALQSAKATLDAADATLMTVAGGRPPIGLLPTWPSLLRNGVVYFWFAALSMVAVAEISQIAGPSRSAGNLVAVFSVLVPACAWAVAWLSVGMLFAPDENGRRPRSVLLGLLLCAVPLVVGLFLAAR